MLGKKARPYGEEGGKMERGGKEEGKALAINRSHVGNKGREDWGP